jgi:GTP-binding protein
VGKSSLINAVSGTRGLARVSKTPGKTRACNVYDVDGRWYLVDLPGYGFARAPHAERVAFRKLLDHYVGTRERLAGAVWLLDIRRDPSAEDLEMGRRFAERKIPVLAAITKADKVAFGRRSGRITTILDAVSLPGDQSIVTSVLSGEGVQDLKDSIENLVSQARGLGA